MHPYITNTEHSTKTLIEIIFHLENKLSNLRDNFSTLKNSLGTLNGDINFLMQNPEIDDEGLGQLKIYEEWEKEIEVNKIKAQISEIEREIIDNDFSITALCGSLLQISKQGISVAHGGLRNCPNGRTIGNESLKNIIWQARNQSMHYEDNNPHAQVRACFQNLEDSHGPKYSLSQYKNLAKDVVILLEWTNYSNYLQDMTSLL
jgi:hypothetical protein